MKKLILRIIPLLGMMLILSGCPQDPAEELAIERRPQVVILVAEGFHDAEAYMPYGYLTNQGIDVTVIGSEIGPVTAYNSDFTIGIERNVNDVSIDEFEALIIPGGKAPSVLRENSDIVDFVTEFFEAGKITAAICHGPQVLVTAGVLEGRTCAGVSGIQEEIEEAGAEYRDEELVIDDNLITSRVPDDLDSFSMAISEAVIEAFDDYVETVLPPQPGM